jgi:hypothetical protein
MAVSVIQIGDNLICSSSALMNKTPGAPHVRQVEFRFPLFQQRPVVTTTVYSPQSPGAAFVVWDVKVNTIGDETQIVVSATNAQTGVGVPFDYYCDIVAIGQGAKI